LPVSAAIASAITATQTSSKNSTAGTQSVAPQTPVVLASTRGSNLVVDTWGLARPSTSVPALVLNVDWDRVALTAQPLQLPAVAAFVPPSSFNATMCMQLLVTEGNALAKSLDPLIVYCVVQAAQAGANICPKGSEGPICGICSTGYQISSDGNCVACPTGKATITYFVLSAVVIVVVLAVIFYIVLRSSSKLMKQEQERDRAQLEADQAEWNMPFDTTNSNADSSALTRIGDDGTLIVPPDISFKLKILLGFFQKGYAITSGLIIAWPTLFRQCLNYVSTIANFNFIQSSSVDCVIKTSYYTSFLTMTVLPLALIVFIFVAYLLPKRLGVLFKDTDDKAAKRSRRRFWKIIIFFLFLIYPSVSAYALGLFDCRDYYGQFLLFKDLTIDCTSDYYKRFSLFGSLMILLYPIGIPAFFIWKIRQYRYPKDGVRASRLNEPGVLAELGFLYDAYNRDLWWFDSVDSMEKLFLCAALPLVPAPYTLPVGMFVAVGFMMIVLLNKPFSRKADDRLALLAECELFIIMLTAYSFQTILDDGGSSNDTLSYILLALASLFLIFVSVQAVGVIKKLWKLYKEERANKSLTEDEEDDDVPLPPAPKLPDNFDQLQQQDEEDEDDVDIDSLDASAMQGLSQEAKKELEKTKAAQQARKAEKRKAKIAKRLSEQNAATEANVNPSSKEKIEAAVVALPSAIKKAAAGDSGAGMEIEMMAFNPMFKTAAVNATTVSTALASELFPEEELSNTPQGKYEKLHPLERRKEVEADAEVDEVKEELEKEKDDMAKYSHIQRVDVSVAPTVLFTQKAKLSTEALVKKDFPASSLKKK